MSLHWIDLSGRGRLAIAARPRAGHWLADEIAGWRRDAVEVVVSLLEPSEIAELDLREEAELCRRHGLRFVSFPIADRAVPSSMNEAIALARSAARWIAEGRGVAIHCRAGIGRAAMIAACVLVCLGDDADVAFTAIGKARGVSVPDTDEQRQWVSLFGERLVQQIVSSCPTA
jgi:protein-tyrosine phosphatase